MSRNSVKYDKNAKGEYTLQTDIHYYSTKYHKAVSCYVGMYSDGATGAKDIRSESWWVHDKLCDTGVFDDGTKCTNLQASTVLYDILKREGYWFRARTWFIATLALGGGKARRNGMF